MGEFLVDIPMCAYNNEKYIAMAIDGVLLQKTNFNYRLIIGEDSSTDNTRSIVKMYVTKFPDKISAFFHDKNIGAQENSKILFKACNSKYIALCDSDDYWTDPLKLQKQVDVLESNEDQVICYHRVNELRPDGELTAETLNISVIPMVFSILELAKGNIIHTPSVVYRNGLIPEFPEWFSNAPVGDYVIHMLNARYGKIHYLPSIMAVYRVGVGSHGALQQEQKLLNWEVTLKYLLTLEWPASVSDILKSRLKILREIMNRNKFKTLYKIRDALVTITGLRLLKRMLTNRMQG